MAKSKKRKEYIDYLEDAVYAVMLYDEARLQKKTDQKYLHQEAIKRIELCNREFGKGYINISKARNILQIRSKRA